MGIGAGDAPYKDTVSGVSVEISGGIVRATSSKSAGIGASDYSSCGAISISGGTVFASTANPSAKGIGNSGKSAAESVTITGGAVYSNLPDIGPAPVDGSSQAVFPVDIPLGVANAKVEVSGILRNEVAHSYGLADMYTDETGKLRIWLPNGAYVFTVPQEGGDPVEYAAVVKNGAATAVVPELVGLTVNGRDIAYLGGNGWEYAAPDVMLSSDMDYVVSGVAANVRLRVAANAAVTLDGVSIDCSQSGISPFEAGAGTVSVILEGENTLVAGENSAGLAVEELAQVAISGEGSLAASGGTGAAGIGGSRLAAVGAVSIAGGSVSATGGDYGAGIGSGRGGSGGRFEISGGTVAATGGSGGPGIGGGDEGANAVVEIKSGKVTATGGWTAAGIGGGNNAKGNSVSISGGEVVAKGGQNGAGVGTGRAAIMDFSTGDTVTISGGVVSAEGGSDAADIGCGFRHFRRRCDIRDA